MHEFLEEKHCPNGFSEIRIDRHTRRRVLTGSRELPGLFGSGRAAQFGETAFR